MATENQIRALENWLNGQLGKDEAISEMPFEICSDALSRLSEASQAFKAKKLERGGVTKVKKEIIDELRQEGWIDEPTDAPVKEEIPLGKSDHENLPNRTIGSWQRAEQEEPEPDIYIDENEYEELNDDDFEDEVEDVQVEDPVSRYVNLIAKITETVEEDERIPPHEKGYAVNNVFQAVSRDLRTELIAGLAEKRGENAPSSDF